MKNNPFIILTIVMLLILSSCSIEKRSAQEYWDSGSALFEVDNHKGAIKQYTKLIKHYPDNELALKADFSIAEIYKNNLKDYSTAIAHYKKIQKKYPDSEQTPNAIFMIGYIFANEMKNSKKAKTAYEYFIKTYPNHILVQSAQWELKNLGKSLEEIQKDSLTE